MHRSHTPSIQGNILAFILTPLQLAWVFSFLPFLPLSLCLLLHRSCICFIYPCASCLFLFCCDCPYMCCTFQSLLSPLLFLTFWSPGTRQQIIVSCSTWSVFKRVKLAKMMGPGEVHLAGVHADKIPLRGSTLFTQAICHCQLVVNVQVGSLAICS